MSAQINKQTGHFRVQEEILQVIIPEGESRKKALRKEFQRVQRKIDQEIFRQRKLMGNAE